MSFYEFLKGIQEGIEPACRVQVRLCVFGGVVNGLEVQIDWENDFHYMFVIPEALVKDDGFLRHFQQYTIHNANREYRIAEVGED